MRQQARENALREIQQVCVLHEIGEAEGIEVSDEDFEQDMAAIAERTGAQLDAVADYLADEDRRGSLVQFDLLHHSRRRWGRGLPDCKLQTLERHVCGRARTGDIPGRDIPETYHEYVRTGDAWPVRNILHHNALDLITLLQLALCIFHHP